jgi:MarR family transcriptional regulator, temperature-dependent positive regulator of motility
MAVELHLNDAKATRASLGFLLAKASQAWNEALYEKFADRGFPEVRPSYGSILLPLFEEDGLRMGELARQAGLAKQTMTTMVRLLERDGLVRRVADPADRRAGLIYLTERGRDFQPVAEKVLDELEARTQEQLTKEQTIALKLALKGVIDI